MKLTVENALLLLKHLPSDLVVVLELPQTTPQKTKPDSGSPPGYWPSTPAWMNYNTTYNPQKFYT